jgi:hypothetical protein
VLGLIRPEATAPVALWPVTAAQPNRPRGPVWLAQPTANHGLAGPCHTARASRAQGSHCAQSGRGGAAASGGRVALVPRIRRHEHRRQGAKSPGKLEEGGSHPRRPTTARGGGATGMAKS